MATELAKPAILAIDSEPIAFGQLTEQFRMTTLPAIALQVGLSFFVAISTALLTVWLSLRRYYREKWWEEKMRSYSEVIKALHHMKRDLEISIRAELHGQDTETEFHKEWSARH